MSPGSCPGVTNPHLPKPGPEIPGNEMNCFYSQPGCVYPWAVDASRHPNPAPAAPLTRCPLTLSHHPFTA